MYALNQEQQEAINSSGDILLVACPGSGKTHTLIQKIAAELGKIDSHREFVVALTYTHVAVEEIRDRVEAMGLDTRQLWVGTIHSFCLTWILRPYRLYHENLVNGFSVVDTFEGEELLDEIAKRHPPLRSQFDCKYFATEHGFSPDKATPAGKLDAVKASILDYQRHLLKENKIDFEMMLKYAYDLIANHWPIAQRLSRLFRIIAVDEYQDTREIQYSIISKIIRAKESTTKLFLVGDPNQAIFGSLGGVAKSLEQLRALTGREVTRLTLTKNYRSTQHIIDYYSQFAVDPLAIRASGTRRDQRGDLVYDATIERTELVEGIAKLVRHNVEVLAVPPEQICIVAPWWMHLASVTRSLVQALPGYDFNGPGLSPFGQNRDNFWYKVARIALTESAPNMYRRRVAWAREIVDELVHAGQVDDLTPRDLLKLTNSIQIRNSRGSEYLRKYFEAFVDSVGITLGPHSELLIQLQGFFERMTNRLSRILKEEGVVSDDLELFRAVFRPRTGIVVSTIHGVKGTEFDSVIAFGLLEGFVPHFSEPEGNKRDIANKLMFVIASRARQNLYLISERGRGNAWGPRHPSDVLESLDGYNYSSRSITNL